jgi:hypothetical protein
VPVAGLMLEPAIVNGSIAVAVAARILRDARTIGSSRSSSGLSTPSAGVLVVSAWYRLRAVDLVRAPERTPVFGEGKPRR